MFYIIGVDHSVQSKQKDSADSDDQEKFRGSLAGIISRAKPVVVAEEFSQHALKKQEKDNGESVTKAVASSFDVQHRFCDPEPDARAKMGYCESRDIIQGTTYQPPANILMTDLTDWGNAIEVAKYWPIREKCWLEQLDDVKNRDVVFVCGDEHVDSFRELLKQNHICSTVEARDIGVTESEHDRWIQARNYLKNHPELRDQ